MPDMRGSPGANLAERYGELLDIQEEIAAGVSVTSPRLTREEARDILAAGEPLLSFYDFFPEWVQAKSALQRVVAWAAKHADNSKDKLEQVSMDMGETLYRELALVWYNGGVPRSPDRSLASTELVAIVGASLKPFLQALSRLLAPLVEQAQWRRRQCPVCGSKPDFGYVDREQGARWLICSRCDVEWLFKRLECPYCGTQDQTKLSYLSDDAEQYRLYVCDACHSYIKTIDMRRVERQVRLPLERFLTLDMDRQARAKGYLSDC